MSAVARARGVGLALLLAACFGNPNPEGLVYDPGPSPRQGHGRVYAYTAGTKEKLYAVHTVLMNQCEVGEVERTYKVSITSPPDATVACTYLRLDVPAGDYIFDAYVGHLDHGAEQNILRDRRSMIRRMYGIHEPPASLTVEEGRTYYLRVHGTGLQREVRFQTPNEAQPWIAPCLESDTSTLSELGFCELPPKFDQ